MREELRYTLSTVEGTARAVGLDEAAGVVAHERISPGDLAPVAIDGAIENRRWGLLPRWRGHGGKRGPMITTVPADAFAQSPQLRDARPCLVIADGFLGSRGGIPLWIHPEPPGVIALAGLVETSRDDGVPSFALVVGAPLVDGIRRLMPVPIAPEALAGWLERRELADTPPDNWRADARSRMRSTAQGELF